MKAAGPLDALTAWAHFPTAATKLVDGIRSCDQTVITAIRMAGGACPKAIQASTAAAIGTCGEATRTVVMLAGIAAGTFIGSGDMTAVIAGDPLPLIELDIGTLRIVIGQHRAYEQEDFSQASVFQTLK